MVESELEAPRFLISYAHDNDAHVDAVGRFCALLREHGLDVVLDSDVAQERHSWPIWAMREIAAARRVLIVGSPRFRARFDGTAPPDEGKGVRLEARLICEDTYQDMEAGCRKYVPVLLPGGRVADIPTIFQPVSAGYCDVDALTLDGVREVVELLGRDPVRPEEAPPVARPNTGPTGVFRLRLGGGTLESRDAAAQTFLGAGSGRAAVDFDEERSTVGALLEAPAGTVVRTLARLVRRLREQRQESGAEPLDMTVGAHVDDSRGLAAVRAAELAHTDAARRLHVIPGARVVVAASPELYDQIVQDPDSSDPEASAYRTHPSKNGTNRTVHLAVPGRTVCPPVPPAPAHADRPRTPDTGNQHVAGDNIDVSGTGNTVVTGVIQYGTGTVVKADRDAQRAAAQCPARSSVTPTNGCRVPCCAGCG